MTFLAISYGLLVHHRLSYTSFVRGYSYDSQFYGKTSRGAGVIIKGYDKYK
jgi:hypothetical protein